MQNRIKYLDIAKFIGIFCIFLGHFGSSAGYAYEFVFNFHVPLFFFLSGCTESLSSDITWHKYILKNIKNILIPFYLFAIISVVIQCIFTNTYTGIPQDLIHILKGCIRNHFFAGGLWFLTCLFVIKIVFYFLRKLLKLKVLLLIVGFVFYLIAQLVITPKPIVNPHMPYNIDSACYYIVFYALGYCCFGIIDSFLAFDNVLKKVLGGTIGAIAFAFSAALFFGKNLFYFFGVNTILYLISCLLSPIIVITLILIVSRFLESVDVFVKIGENTLFMCGSEHIIKLIVPSCLQIVGLSINYPNPISAYIYTFALLFLCYKCLVPIEKAMFKKLRILK